MQFSVYVSIRVPSCYSIVYTNSIRPFVNLHGIMTRVGGFSDIGRFLFLESIVMLCAFAIYPFFKVSVALFNCEITCIEAELNNFKHGVFSKILAFLHPLYNHACHVN